VSLIPDGTRFYAPAEEARREALRLKLEGVLNAWGYDPVQTPALEVFNPAHPQAEKAFKLVDRDGTVLMLRGEYTTAVANLVRSMPEPMFPVRLRYGGLLWVRTRDAELGRQREYTQVGGELLGVNTPLADAEILSLALECLHSVGFARAAVEIGHPGFVRAVLSATKLEPSAIERLRTAIHRKNASELQMLLDSYGVRGKTRDAVLRLIDLYGDARVLEEAHEVAINEAALQALENVRAVAQELAKDQAPERFLFDLGVARSWDYYTGVIFQAYTPDFGQPLCGGGRYDGAPLNSSALAIPAVGFALGLERILTALGDAPALEPAFAIAVSISAARAFRQRGQRVIQAWTTDRSQLEEAARAWGVPYLLLDDVAIRVSDGARVALEAL
jgi:ATP phosphoribosyltransferase regulatory subunit